MLIALAKINDIAIIVQVNVHVHAVVHVVCTKPSILAFAKMKVTSSRLTRRPRCTRMRTMNNQYAYNYIRRLHAR